MSIITERIPYKPTRINSVPLGVARPRWSVMIPVYNCSHYLCETLESVLKQEPPEDEMNIEVVDDFSTDANVSKLVSDIGGDRVKYFRQKENLGSIRNFHTCINRATGRFVHLLHGDDRIRNGFYKQFDNLFQTHRELGAAFCRYAYVNDKGDFLYNEKTEMSHRGIFENAVVSLAERQRIQYVSMVVKREVYEELGTFYGVEYGEDWEMWIRIASRYKIGYIPDILAEYRRHDNSISGKSFLTGRNMRDLSFVMDKIREYVPLEKRNEVEKTSKKFYAHYGLKTANTLWKNRNKSGAVAQVREAWRMNRDAKLLYKIIKLYTRITLNI